MSSCLHLLLRLGPERAESYRQILALPLPPIISVVRYEYFPPASGISTNLKSGNRVRVSLRLRACRVRACPSITTLCRSSSNSKPLAVGDCERAHNGVNDVADGPATS